MRTAIECSLTMIAWGSILRDWNVGIRRMPSEPPHQSLHNSQWFSQVSETFTWDSERSHSAFEIQLCSVHWILCPYLVSAFIYEGWRYNQMGMREYFLYRVKSTTYCRDHLCCQLHEWTSTTMPRPKQKESEFKENFPRFCNKGWKNLIWSIWRGTLPGCWWKKDMDWALPGLDASIWCPGIKIAKMTFPVPLSPSILSSSTFQLC